MSKKILNVTKQMEELIHVISQRVTRKQMIDDINDRIDNEFLSPSVKYTVQLDDEFGQKRFRTIPEE